MTDDPEFPVGRPPDPGELVKRFRGFHLITPAAQWDADNAEWQRRRREFYRTSTSKGPRIRLQLPGGRPRIALEGPAPHRGGSPPVRFAGFEITRSGGGTIQHVGRVVAPRVVVDGRLEGGVPMRRSRPVRSGLPNLLRLVAFP